MKTSFSGEVTNNNDLKDRILCLSERNLITEEEKNNITSRGQETEKEVFRLLVQKDIKSSIKMLKILRKSFPDPLTSKEDPTQFDTTEDCTHSFFLADNPLTISAVIHNVFRFLKLEDIKNCRYVSQEWNHVAEPFLRKRSQISFGYPADVSCFSKTAANFNYDFKFTQEVMPFTALRLTHFKANNAPWPKTSLEELLQSWGRNLRELKIDSLYIQKLLNVGRQIQTFNITNLFPENHLTKLDIELEYGFHRLEVSLDKLIHIKSLRLVGCILQVKNECVISPIEVEISWSSIFFENEARRKLLNQFIDFRNMKKFAFSCHPHADIVLDLKGQFELDILTLKGVDTLNWSSSNWKIRKLDVSEWRGVTNMHIREMTANTTLESLSDIPETIEKLNFVTLKHFSEQALLPNLTHLVFDSVDANLKCFENCVKLTSLEIKRIWFPPSNPKLEFSTSCLPPNIRKLSVGGKLKIKGNWPRVGLEKLVLGNLPTSKLKSLVSKFKPEEVAISLQPTNGKNVQLFRFLEETDKLIWIGKFKWDKIDFATSNFAAMADKKSEYYVFNNKRGITIAEDEHRRKMEL